MQTNELKPHTFKYNVTIINNYNNQMHLFNVTGENATTAMDKAKRKMDELIFPFDIEYDIISIEVEN